MHPSEHPRAHALSLRAATGTDTMLWGRRGNVWLGNLKRSGAFGAALASLQGVNVLLRTADPLCAALALIELDGVANRIVVVPPDIGDGFMSVIVSKAQIKTVVTDDPLLAVPGTAFVRMTQPLTPLPAESGEPATCDTEWVLFTSGGEQRMTAHSVASLTRAIRPGTLPDIVWGTFHDIRRHAGLQILMRALTGRAPLVLPDPEEAMDSFLTRLARHGVTHLSGAPSHWRRALANPVAAKIAPRHVRLTGEAADQATLDGLRARFPKAEIVHAYASTETGLGFEVSDGLEGFPAALVGGPGSVELRIKDGILHIRSPRTASGFIDGGDFASDGFVDTGDMVGLLGDRYYFKGRRPRRAQPAAPVPLRAVR